MGRIRPRWAAFVGARGSVSVADTVLTDRF
jgi:hypothetical protein